MDAGIEIGVIADRGGQFQAAMGGAVKQTLGERQEFLRLGIFEIENLAEALAQGAARTGAQREKRIEAASRSGAGRLFGETGKEAGFERGAEIQNLVADGDPAAPRPVQRAKDAERQILDREIGMAVAGLDPAQPVRIMRLVDYVSPGYAFPNAMNFRLFYFTSFPRKRESRATAQFLTLRC